MQVRWIVLAASALATGAAPAAAPAPSALQRCVVAMADHADFSGAILVLHDGVPVAQLYRGRLSDPASPPIDATTRFNLASASKMFTAVAIGQLIEQGRLRLDEPIGEVVAGLTPEASRVTVRQLLNHTSALGDFFAPQNMATMMRARSASDILPLIAADRPAFPPGTRFRYSNSGFALLGVAVEHLSGMTYGEYLRRHVFVPAHMTDTGIDSHPLRTLAVGMTRGGMPHSEAGGTPPPGGAVLIGSDGRRVDPASVAGEQGLRPAPGAREGYGSPAGGLFSTAADMARFARALESGKLLSRPLLDQFTSPQVEAAPATAATPARSYGFGFGLADDGGRRWAGHNGGTLGANVEFWFSRGDRWTVEVLSNRDPPVATDIARRLRPIVGVPATAGCG